jgi:hypothetical protein
MLRRTAFKLIHDGPLGVKLAHHPPWGLASEQLLVCSN